MKTKTLFFIIMISLTSCTQKNSSSLSDTEKQTIESDVNLMIDSLLNACTNLDVEKALSFYENSPEFMLVGVDGSISDYNSTYKSNKDFFTSCTNASFRPIRKDNIIINDKLVLQTLLYSATVTTNNNERITYDKIGATSLIKKYGDKWRIIHFQESSLPPKIDSINQ